MAGEQVVQHISTDTAAPVEIAGQDPTAGLATPRPSVQLAAETRRLYAADWRAFLAWCRQEGQATLPAQPAVVARYLISLTATLAPGALARRAAAIAERHRRAGLTSPSTDPAVRVVLRAARQSAAEAGIGRLSGAKGRTDRRTRIRPSTEQLSRMAARCPGDLAGLRDRVLLLLSAAGLRGEQLLDLDREHVQLDSHQVELTLVDQEGRGREAVVLSRGASSATCPVRALDQWLHSSDTRFGPVFRKVDRWGNVEHRRLQADALRRIWKRRATSVRIIRRSRPAVDVEP